MKQILFFSGEINAKREEPITIANDDASFFHTAESVR